MPKEVRICSILSPGSISNAISAIDLGMRAMSRPKLSANLSTPGVV